MQDTEFEAVRARVQALQAEHEKAVRYRDKWAGIAAEVESKLRAFQLVIDDLGVEVSSQASKSASSSGLSHAVREAILLMRPEQIVTPKDLCEVMDSPYRDAPTSSITKALVRLTEEEQPVLALEEKGRGKRQSKYRVLRNRDSEEFASEQETDDEEESAPVTRFRQMAG